MAVSTYWPCCICGGSGYHQHWCPNYTVPKPEMSYPICTTNHTKNMGWLCPRCNRVNAPDVKQCGCKPEYEVEWPNDSTDRKWPLSGGGTGDPVFNEWYSCFG